MRNRVAHLSSVHAADDVRIVHKMCRGLADNGFDVHLCIASDRPCPVHNITVHRLPPPKNRLERLSSTLLRVFRAARSVDADLYHFHDPELISVGLALKALGKRVVYDVHENIPKQLLVKPYIPGPLKAVLPPVVDFGERTSALAFDGVVAATEAIRDRVSANGIVVRNYPRLSEFDGGPSWASRGPTMGYVGAICEVRGVKEMLASLRTVQASDPAWRLLLAGRFSPENLPEAFPELLNAEAVDYRGRVGRAEVTRLLHETAFGLCIVRPTTAYVEGLPTKAFEYMAAGALVVASDFPYWKRLFGDVAYFVDSEDRSQAGDVILEALRDPEEATRRSELGRKVALERFNWANEEARLVDLYRKILA